MRRRVLALPAALLGALLAAAGPGCGKEAARGADLPRTVLDATGASVRLPAVVRRVVTTLPGLTDTVIRLGARDLLVGVSERDPADAAPAGAVRLATWPSIAGERVAALEPDLVVVDGTLSPRDLEGLRAHFPGTFASDSHSLDGLARTFRALGEALDRKDAAAGLERDLALARREARVEGSPRVLLLTWADPVMALGPGALLDDMLQSVGAENVAKEIGRPSGEIPAERVLEWAPQWILLTGGTFPDRLRTAWAAVPAVKDGRVVDASADDLVQAGPGTAKALRRLADLLRAEAPPR